MQLSSYLLLSPVWLMVRRSSFPFPACQSLIVCAQTHSLQCSLIVLKVRQFKFDRLIGLNTRITFSS
jgi:hypothetical protein